MLWLYMGSFVRMPSASEELFPFDCLNFNDFTVVSHNFVSNGLNIYDYSEVMHVEFHKSVIHYRGVIAL